MPLNLNSIVLIAFMVFVVGGVGYARWRIRRLSRQFLGTDDLMEGIRQAKLDTDAEQKSLTNLTRVLLPKIQHDFPNFNWEEYKAKIQDSVRECIVKELKGTEPGIHETGISDYRNQQGTCSIKTQTTAGYRDQDGTWKEKRYNSELVYVQDVSKLPPTQTAVGVNCPNCGAPVKMLGTKYCDYCGTAIRELNIRVWRLAYTKVE